jgi:hypothetical protein
MATAATTGIDTRYFFQQLASAEKRFLVLDFDTTLAHMDGAHAARFPLPVIGDLLEMIAATARTRLVLATSAPNRELALSLACPDLEIWGTNGLEKVVPATCRSDMKRVPLRVHTQTSGDRRHTLIMQRCARHPLAYLVGAAGFHPGDDLFVIPELHLNNKQVLTGMPESLVQFLAEWLRVCAGEVC